MTDYQSRYTGEQIDAAVRQTATNTRDIATETTRATRVENELVANNANTVNRMRGETTVNDDPFHQKRFSNSVDSDASRAAAEWLDGLATNLSPIGILRIWINGSLVLCINNVRSYANSEWTQTLLNAYVDVNGRILPSTGIYTRESSLVNDVITWSVWKKIAG